MKVVGRFQALLTSCVLFAGSILTSAGDRLPNAKLTIMVKNEDGRSLKDIAVCTWFDDGCKPTGQTDSNGVFVAEGACSTKDIPIRIAENGYYESLSGYSFSNYLSVENGKWQPWNPVVTVVVRRVVNPIPMYMKRLSTDVPAVGKEVGFDLVVGDWVAPYGTGKTADVFFQVTRRITNSRDFELVVKLSYPQVGAGIQQVQTITDSSFMIPREAPRDGYQKEWSKKLGCEKGTFFNTEEDHSAAFAYRVRVVSEPSGEISRALYGVIKGNLRASGYLADKIHVEFTYYLNPTPNDRNMEFDPKKNLFKNLKPLEGVTAP